MSRYIDADKLKEELERCSYETWSKDINRAWWAQSVKVKDNIVHCIERQPTADVVEIWNEAIDAFAQRLMRYYHNQSGTTLPVIVEYHVKQIANDLKKEKNNEKDTNII